MAKSPDQKLLDSCNKRLESLRTERTSYFSLWGELADHILTERGRFLSPNERKGPKRNTKQYNNTPLRASRTLASGMMAGITSPARPWFKLATRDNDLVEFRGVKEWLGAVQTLMYSVLSQSNFYNVIFSVYQEIGVFGTGCMGLYEDFNNVVRGKCYTIGSYLLGLGSDDLVDSFYREYQRSVGQLVKEFGIDNCSTETQQAWKNGNLERMVDCVHVIEPNDDRDSVSPFNWDFPYRSVYYEKGSRGVSDTPFLAKRGFREFPIMAPRWDVTGEEVYATMCPGRMALGDCKALQLGEKRMYQAFDKIANSPTQGGPSTLNKNGGQLDPGEHVTLGPNDQPITPVFANFNGNLEKILAVQERTENRISESFFENLFLAMMMSDRRQMTATEVAERHEEKLLALGPVLERLHAELLDKIIDRVFDIMLSSGLVPPPPAELQGQELRVEYISILAQAQKMVGITSLERTVGFAASMVQVWPETRHKVNAAQVVEEYSLMMGVPPKAIRSNDEVDEIMAAEQQALQQQQMMDQLQQRAATAKDAAAAPLDQDNALTQTLRNAGLM